MATAWFLLSLNDLLISIFFSSSTLYQICGLDNIQSYFLTLPYIINLFIYTSQQSFHNLTPPHQSPWNQMAKKQLIIEQEWLFMRALEVSYSFFIIRQSFVMLEVSDETIHSLFKHPTFISHLNEHFNQGAESAQQFEGYTEFSLKRFAREFNDRLFLHLREQIGNISNDLEEAIKDKYQNQLETIKEQVRALKKQLTSENQLLKEKDLNPEHSQSYGNFPISVQNAESQKPKKDVALPYKRSLADSLMELSCIIGRDKILDLQCESQLSQNISQSKLTQLQNLSDFKSKIKQVESYYTNLEKQLIQWHIDQKEKIEENYKKMAIIRERIDDKIQTHFSGIWQVVADLQEQFIRYKEILSEKGLL